MHKFFATALAQERLDRARVSEAIGNDKALNRAFEMLFGLATCREGCRGGDHVIEALLGRIVNQSIAGILLDATGFHDEAFGAVRSVGEITNLLALFRLDPPTFDVWVRSADAERKKRFSPVKVRLEIERHGAIAIPMDRDAYDFLCERYVHVNPSTAPNSHGPDGLRHVGGYNQTQASGKFHQALTYLVLQAAMLASSMLNRRDLLGELTDFIEEQSEAETI